MRYYQKLLKTVKDYYKLSETAIEVIRDYQKLMEIIKNVCTLLNRKSRLYYVYHCVQY